MSEKGYHILLVEDEEEHASLVQRVFQKESPTDTITHLASAQQLWNYLRQQPTFDLVILDYSLPDSDGLTLLSALQMRKLDKPVIMITGYGDETIALKAAKLGAIDYVVKSPTFPQTLPVIANRAVNSYQLRRRFDEAEAHLQFQALLLDNVHDAIIGTDMDNDIIYWNHGAERIFGWAASDILGQNIVKILPEANQEELHPQFNKLRLATEVNGEWLGITSKNKKRWLSIRTRLIYDSKDTNIGLLNVAQDITEHKRLQEQTDNQIKQTEVINRVLTTINASVELGQLLPEITSLLKQVFECEQVWFDPGDNFQFSYLHQKTNQQNLEPVLQLSKELSRNFYISLQKQLLNQISRITIADKNTFSDPSWQNFLEKYKIKSQVFITLQPQSSSLWVLALARTQTSEWKNCEKELLTELSKIITLALEKTLLYQRTHDAATYEQIINSINLAISESLDIDKILENVCEQIKKHLQVDRCVFFEVTNTDGLVVGTVTHEKCSEEWPKLLGNKYYQKDYGSDFDMIWEGKPWIIDGSHQIDSMTDKLVEFVEKTKIKAGLLAPITNRENTLVGAIALYQCGYVRNWTEDEIALVKSIAQQCAIAINKAQLYGQSRKAEERYRSLFDNANDAIIIADVEHRKIIDANARAEKLLGQTQNELLQLSLLDLHPTEDHSKYLSCYLSLKHTSSIYLRDAEVQQKNGATLPVELRASVIGVGQGSFIQTILRDMTEQRKLEQQLFHSQRLESIGTLTGGIAHDFNNLLAGILGYAELLKKKLDPTNAKLYNYAGIIEQSATHGAELAQRLVAFARGGSPKSQLLDLNSIVEDTLKLLKRALGRSIEIKSSLHTELHSIEANATQIQQILMNLCINARDAMPNGGELIVSTDNVEINQITVQNKGLKLGSYVLLTVKDNGTGMDESTISRIFEPFFTTKEIGKGTGLGLAMVATIVREAKGHVKVDSEIGKGTTFRIYLPAVEENIAQVPSSTTTVSVGTETILVVDDEETLRYLAKDLLEPYGYKILLAADGPEALEIYRSKCASISALLLDMVMPKMSGREVYQKVLEINPLAKVVFASGYCPPEEIDQIWQSGMTGFVQKPYQIEDLAAELRKILDKDSIK